MKRISVGVFATLVVVTLTLIAPAPTFAAGSGTTPGVIPPNANPYGMTYGQWSAAQWQWTIQSPNITTSPVVDPNPGSAASPEPVDCALGNTGRVWFLGGINGPQNYTTAYRSCSIPAGVALFFPVIDAWGDNSNCANLPQGTLTGDQLAQLLAQQTNSIVAGSMSVTVDGRNVSGLNDSTTQYRATAAGFSYVLPANNWLSPLFCPPPNSPIPAGSSPPPPGAYADGVYIMLAPLSVGVHHLSFTGQAAGGPLGNVTQNVTYTLTVAPNSRR